MSKNGFKSQKSIWGTFGGHLKDILSKDLLMDIFVDKTSLQECLNMYYSFHIIYKTNIWYFEQELGLAKIKSQLLIIPYFLDTKTSKNCFHLGIF